jgi:hypothetical protein
VGLDREGPLEVRLLELRDVLQKPLLRGVLQLLEQTPDVEALEDVALVDQEDALLVQVEHDLDDAGARPRVVLVEVGEHALVLEAQRREGDQVDGAFCKRNFEENLRSRRSSSRRCP